MNHLDWRTFLARHLIDSPSARDLAALSHGPILITGAGGSIGSALALRLACLGLPSLLLLESSENNLYRLQRSLKETAEARQSAGGPAEFILGSAGDLEFLEELFAARSPQIVFHAAAHKHAPLLEEQPLAAIANNIFVTETLTDVAAAHGARVMLVSTDKAVEPASVMGATKRVAELIVLARGSSALRLGNVLASSGSVVEVFADQIARGGPITITDPEARRFFLTMDEAVNLLLVAAAQPERSRLLAPALSATHSIVELAQFMANALAPDCDTPIEFTGLRPGDKLTELLWTASDTAHTLGNGCMVAIESTRPSQTKLQSTLSALRYTLQARDLAGALAHLRSLVPDFNPSANVLLLAARSGARVCT
jgi:FlaA1/EpsC-like NDP-sugar epimerase